MILDQGLQPLVRLIAQVDRQVAGLFCSDSSSTQAAEAVVAFLPSQARGEHTQFWH